MQNAKFRKKNYYKEFIHFLIKNENQFVIYCYTFSTGFMETVTNILSLMINIYKNPGRASIKKYLKYKNRGNL